MCHVSIRIKPERLLYYFNDDLLILPLALRKIIEQSYSGNFHHVRPITPAMQIALHQILNCPHRGMTRRLFLESRALELIAYQMEQIVEGKPSAAAPTTIRTDERRRTERARRLLTADLENPPGLEELARTVGMSHPKLNRCFRRIYGITVFGYLRKARLDRARQMLECQGLTVTETACAVGYDSVSHFSQAYKKHFGISPGVHSRAI